MIASTGVTIHSVFDSQGRRIGEYNQATGALIREYVWLNWEPIAVIKGGVTYLVRTDHIGRPVFATNTSGTKVWTATYDPFGGVRTTTGTPINARFPGQWFQSESGLHQNWMRDYDPTTGRYLQADPLGLVDGASVYGYALQSPMMYTDPRGECVGPLAVACFNAGVFLVFLAIDMYFDEDCDYTWSDFGWFTLDYAMSGPPVLQGAKHAPGGGWGGGAPSPGHNGGPFVPDGYWTRNAPDQVTPGSGPMEHYKYNERTGERERSVVEYDQFGRQSRRTDYTTHGYGNPNYNDYHSNPHVHNYTYGLPGFTPYKRTRTNLP